MSQLSVPVNDAAESRDATSPRSRPLWSDALHVFVLSSFAVAQPVYERLGQRLPFLIDQSITAVWCLVFVLSVGLPGTAALCEVLLNRYRRNARDVLHSLIVFVLLVLSSLLLCIHLEMVHGAVVLGLSLALAGGASASWRQGDCAFSYNGEGLYRGWITDSGDVRVMLYEN